jgi:hypothetical protein
MKRLLAVAHAGLMTAVMQAGPALQLHLPPRPADAPCGSEIAREIRGLDLKQREERLLREFTAGNVPEFLRTLRPVRFTNSADGASQAITCWVTPDYLAVGCDTNFLRTPLTPITAQRLADLTDCFLPTPAVADAIWQAADVKLAPEPMPPGPAMTTVAAFEEHQQRIEQALKNRRGLVAGHKKDVVLAPNLTNQVAIYGWHRPNGQPIQPLYTKHAATWVDYSHGIRLVANRAQLNGDLVLLQDVLAAAPRYPTNWPGGITSASQTTNTFGEQETEFRLDPEVRVRLNVPARSALTTNELLILFALPNGNTIEQTAGRRPGNTNDWRYDIQHIAAQTRLVRAALPETRIGIAYLEAVGLSWPAWRKRHGNTAIPNIVAAVRARFSTDDCPFALAAHSGGGSFLFGYVSATDDLPPSLERLAFLDANYAYDFKTHHDKLVHWLRNSPKHRLIVLAYHDSIALLNGKTFVSTNGGTWGRSAAMLEDFSRDFPFSSQTNGPLRMHLADAGRIEFQLRENPERKIWHTVLVERNGFIHALLTGTAAAGKGYEYLGPRAYEQWISP